MSYFNRIKTVYKEFWYMSDFPPPMIIGGIINVSAEAPLDQTKFWMLKDLAIYTLVFCVMIWITALYIVSAALKFLTSALRYIFSKPVCLLLLIIASTPFIPFAMLTEQILKFTIELCGRGMKNSRLVFINYLSDQTEKRNK